MHDICTSQGPHQATATRMRGVSARIPACTEHDDLEAVGLARLSCIASERDEPARHLTRQCSRELQRISFAPSEESTIAEHSRRNVGNSHAASLADHAG